MSSNQKPFMNKNEASTPIVSSALVRLRLSATQMDALQKLSDKEWKCSFEAKCSIKTLRSLVRLGLAEKRGEGNVGAYFSPRIIIEWRRMKAA